MCHRRPEFVAVIRHVFGCFTLARKGSEGQNQMKDVEDFLEWLRGQVDGTATEKVIELKRGHNALLFMVKELQAKMMERSKTTGA